MTDLLHMRDNYLREFDARIVRSLETAVILDRTAFYPEGGGQVGDHGTLSDGRTTLQVSDTKKVDGEGHHIVIGGVPHGFGPQVHGVLDWGWRYQCMRFHTAQHVLSRYLQLNHRLETVGNMVKPGESRADYHPIEHFPDDMKRSVEDGVNAVLARNMKVEIRFMPRQQALLFLKQAGYQVRYVEMVPESVTEFRVLIIGDFDASSCAGTHVANTQEVGRIQIGKNKNMGAGKQRIYFSLLDR
jgi:misacylated tRNA(Ala) deacylase